ncbi:acyl carrier protein [Pseudoduganella aquatica]|uniref:Acyl carrier protein n=1 Tax=Pseudoduganella aquatica TaxID=2660641 RepID=A0A7X4HEE4_9BURK|nr:acyl carrier protein [Pseudoduganella aquatica]MYN09723.1 acyl carrier protein [Pseudoduganella aquatica]
MQEQELKQKIYATILELSEGMLQQVGDDTPLIGDASALDSMKLVELCLALEDLGGDLGFDFDWTSDAAMSRSRSMFRAAGALADEFLAQMRGKQ